MNQITRFAHNRCQIDVDGHSIPYIEVYEHKGCVYNHAVLAPGDQICEGTFSITLVRPGNSPLLGMDVATEEELLRWAPMLANAMAVAAGRTSHGPNSRPHNPHGANWFFEEDRSPVGELIAESS